MTNESTAVVPHHNLALAAHKSATDVAGTIKDFAIRRCVTIQGKKYPPVEVWQAVANGFGCVASAGQVEGVDGGIRAVGEVRRIADGHVIATGEGFVGNDEKTWASRPLFARRAMAQTRAISRACRSAFAFVIPMIDAGLATTPAEEMEGVVDVEASTAPRSAAPAPVAAPVTRPSVSQPSPEGNLAFTDRLVDISERQGSSAKGPWTAWFLRFENREESIGTFSQTFGDAAKVMQGGWAKVVARPGRKPGQWELVSIEPAPDDVPM